MELSQEFKMYLEEKFSNTDEKIDGVKQEIKEFKTSYENDKYSSSKSRGEIKKELEEKVSLAKKELEEKTEAYQIEINQKIKQIITVGFFLFLFAIKELREGGLSAVADFFKFVITIL